MRNPFRMKRPAPTYSAAAIELANTNELGIGVKRVTRLDEPERFSAIDHHLPATSPNRGDLELAITKMLHDARQSLDGLNPEFLDQWIDEQTPLHNAATEAEVAGRERTTRRLLAMTDAFLTEAANELDGLQRQHDQAASDAAQARANLLGTPTSQPSKPNRSLIPEGIEQQIKAINLPPLPTSETVRLGSAEQLVKE